MDCSTVTYYDIPGNGNWITGGGFNKTSFYILWF